MIFIPPQNEKKFFFLTDQVYLKQQTRVMAKQHISKSRPTFNLCDFVSTCKKQAISLISSGNMVD